MSSYKTFEETLEKILVPISEKVGQNEVISAIARGMTMFLPFTIGASIFSILGDFPIQSVRDWFELIGLSSVFKSIVSGTINIMAVFVVFSIAYRYAQIKNKNGVMAGLFSLASFFILMPQSIGSGDELVEGFALKYMGSSGLFVAIIIAILISILYVKLVSNKRLVINLPKSVPSMVSESFEPILIGVIILTLVCIVKVGLMFMNNSNIFDLVNQIIATPVLKLGTSPISIMVMYLLATLLFFIGIHPISVLSVMGPIMISTYMIAIEQFQAGEALTNLETLVMFTHSNIGGIGSTLGLLICIFLFGKSKRYQKFAKVSIVPNIFNINEPVVFGLPIILNPILFIPFVLSSIINTLFSWLSVQIGFITTANPIMLLSVPFSVPQFIQRFLILGWKGLVLWIICLVIITLLYYPFFKIIDKRELELEYQDEEGLNTLK